MSARGFSFVKPKIKVGSLKDRRDDFEKLVKHSDRGMATGQASSGIVLSPEAKAEIRKGVASTLKKTSKIRDEIDEIKGTKKEYKAKGGRVGLKKGSFPDLSGDGKTTMKDILIGRGVIKNKKGKKKMMAKKFESPMAKAVKKKNKKKII